MPRLVHLTRASSQRGIERAGIRGSSPRLGLARAVHAMPLVPDFAVSHQWLRELRRGHDERMIAVHFTLPSDEPVLVGPYAGPHEALLLRDAIRRVIDRPAGAEIVVPRAIAAREILAFREITQLVGWTQVPSGQPKWGCVCASCLPSGARDLMRRVGAAYEQAIREARLAKTDEARARALRAADIPLERAKGRIAPGHLASFARSPSEEVRRCVAWLCGNCRWRDVEPILSRLLRDPDAEVRADALEGVARSGGLRRAWPLALEADEVVQRRLALLVLYQRDLDTAIAMLEKLVAQLGDTVVDEIERDVAGLLGDEELEPGQRVRLQRLISPR